jgi:16S rRNA processing protein RimM
VSEELLAVGRITRAHGVRGEVAVQPLTEVEARFAPGSSLLLEDGRTLIVAASRPHQHRLLVRFEGVKDRAGAEGLRGEVLLVAAGGAPPAPEGGFWVHQVVGLELLTEDGRSVGRVTEVLHNPANDVWVTDAGALVPAVRAVVVSVDLEARTATIADLPGLLEEG